MAYTDTMSDVPLTNSATGSSAAGTGHVRLTLAFSPALAIVLACIVGKASLALVGRTTGWREMLLAAAICLGIGLIAVAPMILLIQQEVSLLLRCAMFANMARLLGVVIGASVVVFVGPQSVHRTALIAWMSGFYLAMLLAETLAESWAIKQAALRRGYGVGRLAASAPVVDAGARMG